MPMLTPFHHAFPVRDIAEARQFYGEVLGLPEGRSDVTWIDFDLFGHQVVAHENPGMPLPERRNHHSQVDGHDVPVPHFGVVLQMDDWQELADRLTSHDIEFVIEPYIRFAGEVGEQATMFFLDPSGNALEFKGFTDMDQLFAK
ncbi:MAG: VOC family protein [Fuerstiella sp.]|nr:VOC family protein [Fuerstiella sp.]MCP4509844.1 VOC family protein [Fuerstiella sp.]